MRYLDALNQLIRSGLNGLDAAAILESDRDELAKMGLATEITDWPDEGRGNHDASRGDR